MSVHDVLWLDLSKKLWTQWSHFEFHLLSTLGQIQLLWIEHPLIWSKAIVFSANNEGEVSELGLILALNEGVGGWHLLLSHCVEGIGWNRHEGGS